jgi:acyl-ACP thioesterase
MANIKLPEKKEVEFGGTVRSALEQKRDGSKH